MPADLECPATPPELPREPTPTRVKLSPSGGGGDSPGRASPDSACPICLGKLDNKAFSDGCMHQFCFTCIVEWSKVRAVCPLCKQAFTSIIHNVRSELDYDRYRLPPPAPAADPLNPYIYQPGDGAEARSRWLQMRRQQYRYRSLVLPMLWPVPEGHEYHLPTAPARPRPPPRARLTSDSRRRLYTSDMWARPTPDELTGRYRETGPDFYRNNPACTHRLVPWLNRELNAVLNSPVHLARVMDQIMVDITRVHILSPEFRAQLQPYMTPWTEHFVHELYCYARSPYDMVGYDLHVQYRTGQPESPPTQVMASSASDSSGSDSDIRVLTPPPRPRTPLLVERLSSPEPGPSGSGGAERGVCAALGRVRAFLASARAAEAASDSDNSGSESPLEVVEVLPPRHERAPEVVTLSSDEEPPPPPPAPLAAAQERRRAARRSRRAALLAGEATRPRRAEETARSARDRPEKRRRRDRSVDAAGHTPDPAFKRKHGSSRAAKSRDEREVDRERRRPQRAEEGRGAKANQSSSKAKSSEASVSSTGSERIAKSKSTTTSSVSCKSSSASGKRSNCERSSSIVSSKSTDIMTIEIIGDTTDRSSSNSNSRSRSVLSVAAETVDDRNGKSDDRSHKSKSSDKSHKSKSSDKSHKSKSSEKSHKSKHRDKSSKSTSRDKSKSKSSDKISKSKSSDKSSKSKSSDKITKSKSSDKHHSSSSKSVKNRHNRDSAERRHKKRTRDESRRHKRCRLDSGSRSDEPCFSAASAAPASPQPSTSSGVTAHPRLFHRIVVAPSSASEVVSSSSSSVVGVPARGSRLARCRRLSGSSDGGSGAALAAAAAAASDSDSDSGGEVARRPAVRSAVTRARRAASSGASDSSDW